MTTGKKVLVGIAVVGGGYILYRLVAPSTTNPLLNKTPTANLNTGLLQGFNALLASVFQSGGNPKSGANSYGPAVGTPGYVSPYQTAADPFPAPGGGFQDHTTVPVDTGTVFGPPAPTTSSMSGPSGYSDGGTLDGSGDSLISPTSF